MIATGTNLAYEGGRYEPTPKESDGLVRDSSDVVAAGMARRHRGPCAAGCTPPMIRLRELLEALTKNAPVVRGTPRRSEHSGSLNRRRVRKTPGMPC